MIPENNRPFYVYDHQKKESYYFDLKHMPTGLEDLASKQKDCIAYYDKNQDSKDPSVGRVWVSKYVDASIKKEFEQLGNYDFKTFKKEFEAGKIPVKSVEGASPKIEQVQERVNEVSSAIQSAPPSITEAKEPSIPKGKSFQEFLKEYKLPSLQKGKETAASSGIQIKGDPSVLLNNRLESVRESYENYKNVSANFDALSKAFYGKYPRQELPVDVAPVKTATGAPPPPPPPKGPGAPPPPPSFKKAAPKVAVERKPLGKDELEKGRMLTELGNAHENVEEAKKELDALLSIPSSQKDLGLIEYSQVYEKFALLTQEEVSKFEKEKMISAAYWQGKAQEKLDAVLKTVSELKKLQAEVDAFDQNKGRIENKVANFTEKVRTLTVQAEKDLNKAKELQNMMENLAKAEKELIDYPQKKQGLIKQRDDKLASLQKQLSTEEEFSKNDIATLKPELVKENPSPLQAMINRAIEATKNSYTANKLEQLTLKSLYFEIRKAEKESIQVKQEIAENRKRISEDTSTLSGKEAGQRSLKNAKFAKILQEDLKKLAGVESNLKSRLSELKKLLNAPEETSNEKLLELLTVRVNELKLILG